jgi:tryptophan halogenase
VFLGQGVIPRGYDPLVRVHSDDAIAQHIANIEAVIGKCLAVMPSHAEFVARTCQAPPLAAPLAAPPVPTS